MINPNDVVKLAQRYADNDKTSLTFQHIEKARLSLNGYDPPSVKSRLISMIIFLILLVAGIVVGAFLVFENPIASDTVPLENQLKTTMTNSGKLSDKVTENFNVSNFSKLDRETLEDPEESTIILPELFIPEIKLQSSLNSIVISRQIIELDKQEPENNIILPELIVPEIKLRPKIESIIIPSLISKSTQTISQESPLLLVARSGDTLLDLYNKVYKGVTGPPYDQILALNQQAFSPGVIIIFPMPPGGWNHNKDSK